MGKWCVLFTCSSLALRLRLVPNGLPLSSHETRLHIKQMKNKGLLLSTGTLLSRLEWQKNPEKRRRVYIYLIHFAVNLRLTQHCKPATLQ